MSKLLVEEDKYFTGMNGDFAQDAPPGVYKYNSNPMSSWLERTGKKISKEKATWAPDDVYTQVLGHVMQFAASQDKYSKLGLLHRRGYMLYGPPGTGKTLMCRGVADALIGVGYMAFDLRGPEDAERTINKVKQFPNPTKNVFIVDEIDAKFDYDDTSTFDGSWMREGQSAVFLVTTNNYNALPDAFKCRPGRFDQRFEINAMSVLFVKEIMRTRGFDQSTIDALAPMLTKSTPAAISEIAVRHMVFGQEVGQAAKDVLSEFGMEGADKCSPSDKKEPISPSMTTATSGHYPQGTLNTENGYAGVQRVGASDVSFTSKQ